MKLTEDIEVNGIKNIIINGSRYYRYYTNENDFRRLEGNDIKHYSTEQMVKRIRELINTGKWRIWIHDDTINVVEK